MPLTLTTLVAFAAIVAAACTSGGNPGASPTGDASATAARAGTTITMTPYHVTIDPTDFSPSVTNPWFPL